MPVQKYKKLPVIIHAVQITERTFTDPHPNPEHIAGVTYDPIQRCALVPTLEGTMRGDLGDWLIIGIKGEVYPCKPDIFNATYNLAEAVLDRPAVRSDVMIDIETLGVGVDAVILSIGAVSFDPIAGTVNHADGFYVRVDWDEKAQPGRKIDTGTLKWWLDQKRAVFDETRTGGIPLKDALTHLQSYIGRDIHHVWCNGANFDFGILTHAYAQTGILRPWRYHQETCMRTIKRFSNHPKPRAGNHHNAYDDAVWQAEWVCEVLAMGIGQGGQ